MANKYAKYEVTYATATNHCNRETFNTMVEARYCWNHHQAMYNQLNESLIRPNIVVSAVDNQFAFETYIFPSNKYGEIESYTNLPGSISAVFDIEAALRNAGYQVIR